MREYPDEEAADGLAGSPRHRFHTVESRHRLLEGFPRGISELNGGRPNRIHVARNAILNIGGQAVVGVTAIILVPLIVRALGHEAYGLLALALVTFGAFSLLELGVGRATTKYVAEYLTTGDIDRLRSIFWMSTGVEVLLGLAAGMCVVLGAPILASKIQHVPTQYVGEVKETIFVLALSAPIVMATSTFRAALEGAQRFDLVNYVRVALNLSTYGISLVGAQVGMGIPGIVLLLLLARGIAGVVYLVGCINAMPAIWRKSGQLDGAMMREVFTYSGWVAVSNVVIPFLTQADRYLIAGLVGIEAVTFYAVPFEVISGLLTIPGGIAAALVPAVSSLQVSGGRGLTDLYARAVRYTALALIPLVVIMATFSDQILLIWQGRIFAEKSDAVLQILLIGLPILSVGWVPSSFLLGLGRPDLIAGIHLIQLPLYLTLAYVLIGRWGIVGGAMAYAVRVTCETILVFAASRRVCSVSRHALLTRESLSAGLALIVFWLVVRGIRSLELGFRLQVGGSIFISTVFLAAVWLYILDEGEKGFIRSLLRNPKSVIA